MKWNGQIGPAFIVTVGLVVVQMLTLYTDSKAALSERLAVVETKLNFLVKASSEKFQGRAGDYGK